MKKFKLPILLAIVAIVGIVSIVAVVGGLDSQLEQDLPNPTPVDGCEVHVGGTRDCEHKAKCSVCGKEYGDFGPHKEVSITGVAATCTESGLTYGSKCSVCGDVIKAQTTIPATGHTLTSVSGKEPTCYEDGHTSYKACQYCDYTEGYTTLSRGHNFSINVPEITVPFCNISSKFTKSQLCIC